MQSHIRKITLIQWNLIKSTEILPMMPLLSFTGLGPIKDHLLHLAVMSLLWLLIYNNLYFHSLHIFEGYMPVTWISLSLHLSYVFSWLLYSCKRSSAVFFSLYSTRRQHKVGFFHYWFLFMLIFCQLIKVVFPKYYSCNVN